MDKGSMEDRGQDAASAAPMLDEELYEEPPKLTGRDIGGVIVALVALACIGLAGYVWITPGLGFAGLLSRGADRTDSSNGQVTAVADTKHESIRCEYCGMFADLSASYVMAQWTDGDLTHHDSWDCMFNHGRDEDLTLQSAMVSHYGMSIENPHWLAADETWYLHDTKESVKGSMPPYVAAFASRGEAEAAQPEMGGEVLDFAGLRIKWE
ncbi:nitrous oxide reductase accessory protein NosL [bacterium]|nr:nitrous oxide reductase accessory protein NosL [bacterium]